MADHIDHNIQDEAEKEVRQNPFLAIRDETAVSLQGPEVGLWERFNVDRRSMHRENLLGAFEARLFGEKGPFPSRNFIYRLKNDQERYEALRPAEGILENIAGFAGHVVGAAQDPTMFLGVPARVVWAGKTGLARMVRAGLTGSAINTAYDPIVQKLRIDAGLQETYNARQTALAAVIGFPLPAAVQVGVERLAKSLGARLGGRLEGLNERGAIPDGPSTPPARGTAAAFVGPPREPGPPPVAPEAAALADLGPEPTKAPVPSDAPEAEAFLIPPRSPEPATPEPRATSDDGFVYHATNTENAEGIAIDGLRRYKPHEGTDQDFWPDGGIEPRIYFGDSPQTVSPFAPTEGDAVVLRVARDARIKAEGTGDFFSVKEFGAEEIEMLAKDGRWYPIQRFFQRDVEDLPLFGNRTLENLTDDELALLRESAFVGPRLAKLTEAEETLFEDSLRLTETPANEAAAARLGLEDDLTARALLRQEAAKVDSGEKTARQAAEDYTTSMKEFDPYRFSSKSQGHMPFSEGRKEKGVGKDPDLPTEPVGALLEIVKRMETALGTKLRQGRITMRGAIGVHNRITGIIRQREFNAYEVFSHEAGHALHFDPLNMKTIFRMIARHEAEIFPLSYTPAKPAIEGFAEWFRIFMTSPGYAHTKAPGFHAEFTQWMALERPDVYKVLIEGKEKYLSYLKAPSRDMVSGSIVTSGRPPLRDRIAKELATEPGPYGESLFSFFDRFYTWTLDRLHPAFRAVKALEDLHYRNTGQHLDLPAFQDTYKMLRLSVDAAQMGHLDITRGVAAYGFLTPEGPSLSESIELAVGKDWFGRWRTDDMADFGAYLVSRRALVEYQRFFNKEVPGTPGAPTYGDYKAVVAELEARNPQFREASKLLYEWNSNMLRKKRDAGLITEKYYVDSLEKAEYYVPFMRDFSEVVEGAVKGRAGGGTNRQSIMAAYRGSLRSIINPIESMVSDAYNTAQRIALNDAIKSLRNLAVKAGKGGGIIAEQIPSTKPDVIKSDLIKDLKKAGADAGIDKFEIDDLVAEMASIFGQDEIMSTIFRTGEIETGNEAIVFFWEAGERKALRLGDGRLGKELYLAITGLGKEGSNWVIEFLGGFSTAMRAGITTSPDFLVANYVRDQMAAFILMPKFVPFISGAKGIFEELSQGQMSEAHARAGGLMGGVSVAGLRRGLINKDLRAFRDQGYKITALDDIKQIFRYTEISETGTRLAIFGEYFKTGKTNGLTDFQAAVEAAFQSRDFIDFGRHGSKMLFLRRITTFLNAGLQGMDKSARVLFVDSLQPMAKLYKGLDLSKKDKGRLNQSLMAWIKLGSITALSATYATMYADDPEFQSAGEYLRATHWLFKVPGGEWVAVPKPHELAFFFNAGERMAEGAMRDDPTWRGRWMRSWSYTLMPPSGVPGVQVPLEVMTNYSFFNEREIIPKSQLGLEPFLRYNAYTSEFAKGLAKSIKDTGLEISPGVIDHVITGWGASWGRHLLKVTDKMMSEEKRSEEIYDYPIIQRFVKNLDRGNDASNMFWDEVNATSGRLVSKWRSYKNLVETGREMDALDFKGRMLDDEKAWVQLQTEKVRYKRLHPMRRAADLMRIYSNLRTQVMTRNVKSQKTGKPIPVTPTIASNINDLLTRVSMIEARNALITIGADGWADRAIMDPAQYLRAIDHLEPEILREIDARSKKLKMYSFEGVRSVWPELEERLLRDEKPRLMDLYSRAKSKRDKR